MKVLANLRKRLNHKIINNKRGQGATEYILLLVVVVGLVMIFGPKIKTIITNKTQQLSDNIDEVKAKE